VEGAVGDGGFGPLAATKFHFEFGFEVGGGFGDEDVVEGVEGLTLSRGEGDDGGGLVCAVGEGNGSACTLGVEGVFEFRPEADDETVGVALTVSSGGATEAEASH